MGPDVLFDSGEGRKDTASIRRGYGEAGFNPFNEKKGGEEGHGLRPGCLRKGEKKGKREIARSTRNAERDKTGGGVRGPIISPTGS